jgi:two-component sensor histidine kinase
MNTGVGDRASNALAGLHLNARQWLLVVAAWTLLGLVETTKAYVTASLRGGDPYWLNALIGNMPWWYGWALLTPVVFALASRFPLDRRPFPAVPVHLLASVAVSAVHLAGVGLLYFRTHAHANVASYPIMLRTWLDNYLMLDVLTYWAVAGVHYAIEYHGHYRASELNAARLAVRAAQLEASMTEARLNALRMELNPHFLFNTLNAISGLVRRNRSESAIRMLARLGELLRVTLERDAAQQVPLERELSYLRLYLEIERVRFHDRLTIEMSVEPEALDACVPPLILQPLVENAVRHGIAKQPGAGQVSVYAGRHGTQLVLRVSDTGAGFPAADGDGLREGVGLSNTRARLAQMYGDEATMMLGNSPRGGAVVSLTIPFHENAQVTEEVSA